jgi:hypothetical protein
VDFDADDVMVLEAARISESTPSVDYLMNHDSGSLSASWLGQPVLSASMTFFCVDAVKAPMSGTSTTGTHKGFSDYLSCGNNADKSIPECSCAVAIDRGWGNLDVANDPRCRKTNGTTRTSEPCDVPAAASDWFNCDCQCDQADMDRSTNYTGIIDVYGRGQNGDKEPVGVWYHHPWGTECYPGSELGSPTSFGTRQPCTWKPRPIARVVRGWELYAGGLNTTRTHAGCTVGVSTCPPPVEQVRQNTEIVRGILKRQNLAPWKCEANQKPAITLV